MSDNTYREPILHVVGDTKEKWSGTKGAHATNDPPTGGNDDGGDMETRLAKLESHVSHIDTNIADIKDDMRWTKNAIFSIVLVGFTAIGGLYLYIDNQSNNLRSEIKSDFNNFRSEIKSDSSNFRSEIKSDFNTLRLEMKSDLNTLRSEIKSDFRDVHLELKESNKDIGQIKSLLENLAKDK